MAFLRPRIGEKHRDAVERVRGQAAQQINSVSLHDAQIAQFLIMQALQHVSKPWTMHLAAEEIYGWRHLRGLDDVVTITDAYFKVQRRAPCEGCKGIALLRLVELVARQQFFHRAELRRRHTTRANDETSN